MQKYILKKKPKLHVMLHQIKLLINLRFANMYLPKQSHSPQKRGYNLIKF